MMTKTQTFGHYIELPHSGSLLDAVGQTTDEIVCNMWDSPDLVMIGGGTLYSEGNKLQLGHTMGLSATVEPFFVNIPTGHKPGLMSRLGVVQDVVECTMWRVVSTDSHGEILSAVTCMQMSDALGYANTMMAHGGSIPSF